MSLNLEILKQPDPNWDIRVKKGKGSIYQTSGYAEYLEKSLGMKNEFLIAKKDDEIVGQLVLSSGPLFVKYLKGKRELLFKIFSRFFRVYTFIKGPIVLEQKKKKEIYSLFLDYLNKKSKKGAFMAQDLSLPIEEGEEVYELFKEKGFYQDAWGTFLVDLTQTEDTLWKNLSKTRRNLINRGRNEGVEVKEANSKEDYEKVIDIIEDMSNRNKIFVHPREYYHTLFEVLSSKNLIKTFFIEKNGKGIATVSVYLFNNQAIQTLVAHTNYSLEEKIQGTDILEWHIITWAKKNGYITYDLAGIRPSSSNPKDISLKEYKSRWGGKEIHYPYFSKVYSKPKFLIVNPLKKIAKKFRIGF